MMLASGWAANALAGQYNVTLHAEETDRGAQVQTTTDTGLRSCFLYKSTKNNRDLGDGTRKMTCTATATADK